MQIYNTSSLLVFLYSLALYIYYSIINIQVLQLSLLSSNLYTYFYFYLIYLSSLQRYYIAIYTTLPLYLIPQDLQYFYMQSLSLASYSFFTTSFISQRVTLTGILSTCLSAYLPLSEVVSPPYRFFRYSLIFYYKGFFSLIIPRISIYPIFSYFFSSFFLRQ